ncbi:MAG: Fe-S cluster assembly ATPase SufC [Nitrososphaerota archaeon]
MDIMIFTVKGVNAVVDGRHVLRDVNLEIGEREIHVLFGPNGSGKSSLVMTIIGHPSYKIISGKIFFKGIDITDKPIEERINLGIGVAFQNPPKIHGVRLKELLNVIANNKAKNPKMVEYLEKLKIPNDILSRSLNVGFSGGEIKKTEILQVLAADPEFIILDEPDSGVDVENLEIIGRALSEALINKSALIITHHGHILKYLKPTKSHVMINGTIVCEGDPEQMFEQIMKKGYGWCERCISFRP